MPGRHSVAMPRSSFSPQAPQHGMEIRRALLHCAVPLAGNSPSHLSPNGNRVVLEPTLWSLKSSSRKLFKRGKFPTENFHPPDSRSGLFLEVLQKSISMNPPFLSSRFQEKRGGGTALTCSSLQAEAEAESPGTTYHVEDTGAIRLRE